MCLQPHPDPFVLSYVTDLADEGAWVTGGLWRTMIPKFLHGTFLLLAKGRQLDWLGQLNRDLHFAFADHPVSHLKHELASIIPGDCEPKNGGAGPVNLESKRLRSSADTRVLR